MQMIEVDWNAVISAAGGGSVAIGACKAFFAKSLREIEQNTGRVNEALVHIAAIKAKMESIEHAIRLLSEHDRKIAKLETAHGFKR